MAHSKRLDHVVVVGASVAGLRACETLRSCGFAGAITLIGAEAHQPYDRPPLSKQLLAGTWDVERVWLRQPQTLDDLGLTMRLGVPAEALDLDARAVALADGTDVPFDGLIIATGTQPRRLPGQLGVPNVHELRTLDDALALRDVISSDGARIVVIGAGFIGLEVAATARRAGCDVTVVEAAAAPLLRGAGPDIGPQLAAVHDDEGVAIRCGVYVAGLRPDGVEFGDGSTIDADAVVVGIGVEPATAWLEGSGLRLGDGVMTSPSLSVGAPGTFAAGDIARWTNPCFAEEMRVEHWTNAGEQGALAAVNLLAESGGGAVADLDSVPYVWSDQYDHRVQVVGRVTAADGASAESEIVLGTAAARRFVAVYHHGGVLRGAVALNLPRPLMKFRALIARRAPLSEARSLAASAR